MAVVPCILRGIYIHIFKVETSGSSAMQRSEKADLHTLPPIVAITMLLKLQSDVSNFCINPFQSSGIRHSSNPYLKRRFTSIILYFLNRDESILPQKLIEPENGISRQNNGFVADIIHTMFHVTRANICIPRANPWRPR